MIEIDLYLQIYEFAEKIIFYLVTYCFSFGIEFLINIVNQNAILKLNDFLKSLETNKSYVDVLT